MGITVSGLVKLLLIGVAHIKPITRTVGRVTSPVTSTFQV